MSNSISLKILFVIALVVFGLMSCSGPSSIVVKVKPERTEIAGALAEYLQVVDTAYELSEFWGAELTIKLKGIKKVEVPKNKVIQITILLLDENGQRVQGTGELKMLSVSEDKILSLLKKGEGVEEIYFESASGDYIAEKHSALVKKISVSSRLVEKEKVIG